MSDLYLVLRSRLAPVGKRFEWVDIGPAVMLDARRATGLSREAVARSLSVSSKTYERYEKTGRVPRHEVANVARVLGLEIEEAEPAKLTLTQPDDARLEEVERLAAETHREVEEVAAAVGRIEELLRSRAAES